MGKIHSRPAVSPLAPHPALRRGGVARWAAFLFICSNQEEHGQEQSSATPAKTRGYGAGRQNRPCGSHSTELALISVPIALANSLILITTIIIISITVIFMWASYGAGPCRPLVSLVSLVGFGFFAEVEVIDAEKTSNRCVLVCVSKAEA